MDEKQQFLIAENEALRLKNESLKRLIKDTKEIVKKSEFQAKKYRKKAKLLKQQSEEQFQRITKLTTERDKLLAEKEVIIEDERLLKLELETEKAQKVENEHAKSLLESQSKELTAAVNQLKEHLERQKNEIEESLKGREQCLQLVEELHRALTCSEVKINDLLDENERLKKATKKSVDIINLNELVNPFQGELRDIVERLFQSEKLKTQQKLQTVLNESAKMLQLKSEPNSDLIEENQRLKNILGSLVENLKQIGINEDLIKAKGIESGVSVKKLVEQTANHKIQKPEITWESDQFVEGLLAENSALSRQIAELVETSEKLAQEKKALIQKFKKAAKSHTFAEQSLKTKFRVAIQGAVQECNNLKEITCTMGDENQKLKTELQIMHNRIVIEESRKANVSEKATQAMDTQLSDLQQMVVTKSSELEEKSQELEQSKEQIIYMEEMIGRLNVELQTVTDAYGKAKLKEISMRKKRKKSLKTLANEYQKAIQQNQSYFENCQKSLEQSNSELKEKLLNANTLTQRLSDSLTESKKTNQTLSETIAKLRESCRNHEVHIKALEEGTAHERQTLQAQVTTRVLAAETKLHESNMKERMLLLGKLQKLIDCVGDELGAFYGIEVVDVETCQQLLIRAREDLHTKHS